MGNFVIATAILFVLNKWAVLPLTRVLIARRASKVAVAVASDGERPISSAVRPTEDSIRVFNQCYLLASLIVMISAGAIAGLLGFRFIGFSLSRRGWPGILAFCATSFLFASLRAPI